MHLLATSKPKVFAEKILRHFLLEPYFSVIMGSELNGNFEEKDVLIAEVLKKVPKDLRPETVMIGDRSYDVRGARANHIDVISVGYGLWDCRRTARFSPQLHRPKCQGLKRIALWS